MEQIRRQGLVRLQPKRKKKKKEKKKKKKNPLRKRVEKQSH
jgi:hypothetical protein